MTSEREPEGRPRTHHMAWLHYDEDVFCCVHCGALPEAAAEEPICSRPDGPRIAEYDPEGLGAAAAAQGAERARRIAEEITASLADGDDLGDVLARALGLAADRAGSVEALVSRRPHSSEAGFLRGLAQRYATVART